MSETRGKCDDVMCGAKRCSAVCVQVGTCRGRRLVGLGWCEEDAQGATTDVCYGGSKIDR